MLSGPMVEYENVIGRLETLARDRGLAFNPVVFQLTDSDEIAEVASMGLPNRFVHWYWGGVYNREMKQLMLDHAFQFVESVILIIGSENWRSRRAAEKIGAVLTDRRDKADRVVYQIRHSKVECPEPRDLDLFNANSVEI